MKISIRMLLLETLAVIVLLAIVGAGVLAWRLSQGPLDLGPLKPRIEAALSDARGGRPVTIGGVALEWSPDKRRIEASITNITLFDKNGEAHVGAKTGSVEFDTGEMIQGRFKTVTLRLEDGEMAFRRSLEQGWAIQPIGDETVGVNAEDIVEQPATQSNLDFQAWRDWLPELRGMIAEQSFEDVQFQDFKFDITDEISGIDWQAENVSAQWSATQRGVMIDISGELSGENAPEAAHFTFFSDPAVEAFSFEIGIVGADPERLASFLAAQDSPLRYEGQADINFGGEASEADGIKSLQFSAAGENGVLVRGKDRYDIERASFEVLLDMQTRRVDLTQLDFVTDKASGSFSGWTVLEDYFKGVDDPKYPFVFSARDARIDATPMFEGEWDIQSLDVSGAIRSAAYELTIDRMIGRTGGLNATGQGRMFLAEVEGEDTRLFGAELTAIGEGEVTPAEILAYWPVNLGASARGWVRDHVSDGVVTSLNLKLDYPPGVKKLGYLPDENLTLDFTVERGEVSFLSDLPPVTKAKGSGKLKGNSLVIDLERGELGGWVLDTGQVDLPQFYPAGAESVVTSTGRGDLRQVMAMLENSRLKVGTNYGLDIDRMTGLGGLDIVVKRPMRSEVPDEEVLFDIKGGFVDAIAPDLAAGFGLQRTDLDVQVDNKGLVLKGAGRFGPAPVEFTWTEVFDGEDKGSGLEATAVVTPDLMNAFGFAARTFMQGEAEVELSAFGRGRDFEEIDAEFDFTDAALDLSDIGWVKPYNVPAKGVVRYGSDENGNAIATGDIVAEGLELAGEVLFSGAAGIQRAAIERIYAKDQIDLRGDFVRSPDGALKIDVSGPFLDASPWIDQLINMGGAGQGPGANVSAKVAVDQLKLREETSLRNAQLVLEMSPEAVERGLISGTIAPGKGVEATIETDGEDRIVSLRSDDAGFVFQTIAKVGFFEGGVLSLDGRFGKKLGSAQIRMSDVRMRDAPLFAQVFSLASLRGLTDLLNGDGVLFTNVEAPIRIVEGRVDIPGARASGPALGLTTRGWVGLKDNTISLDGVVVPSFGVNSALGGIPIIGDLFVSRQGEGVFAVTYSVRGDMERARVSINPLSAVTPGFLRRMMENPSEEPEPPQPEEPATPTEPAPAAN